MQFIRGINEPTVPEVSLRRARTGTSGSAMLLFENPSIFQASGELGEITGAHLMFNVECLMATGWGGVGSAWRVARGGGGAGAGRPRRGAAASGRGAALGADPLPCPDLPTRPRTPGLFMIDDEGELSTTDVKAKFVNGKPQVRRRGVGWGGVEQAWSDLGRGWSWKWTPKP
jgi:hypothetical protein